MKDAMDVFRKLSALLRTVPPDAEKVLREAKALLDAELGGAPTVRESVSTTRKQTSGYDRQERSGKDRSEG